MKHSAHTPVICLLVASLSGCAYQPPKDVNSTFYSPPAGSKLQLHSALTIPANNTEVYIQDGKVISSYWSIDAYYPNCNFELRERAEVKRRVQPDTFTIFRVVRNTENVMLGTPTVVASSSSGNGAPNVDFMIIMDLHSERQPGVMRITCRQWEDPSDGNHLSIVQIRKTLGDLFTLRLPDA